MSSSVKKEFNKLCSPAKFYLVISVISVLIYILAMMNHVDKMHTSNGLVVQVIGAIIWTLVLNWICSAKHGNTIAWILVFLPLILAFVMMFFIFYLISDKKITSEDLKQIVESAKEDENKEGFCGSCS
jgi:phosphotransferase system  glucose/maltose/N-acetylglucosamine-specific IIC component